MCVTFVAVRTDTRSGLVDRPGAEELIHGVGTTRDVDAAIRARGLRCSLVCFRDSAGDECERGVRKHHVFTFVVTEHAL